jgi:hypothetical protein
MYHAQQKCIYAIDMNLCTCNLTPEVLPGPDIVLEVVGMPPCMLGDVPTNWISDVYWVCLLEGNREQIRHVDDRQKVLSQLGSRTMMKALSDLIRSSRGRDGRLFSCQLWYLKGTSYLWHCVRMRHRFPSESRFPGYPTLGAFLGRIPTPLSTRLVYFEANFVQCAHLKDGAGRCSSSLGVYRRLFWVLGA